MATTPHGILARLGLLLRPDTDPDGESRRFGRWLELAWWSVIATGLIYAAVSPRRGVPGLELGLLSWAVWHFRDNRRVLRGVGYASGRVSDAELQNRWIRILFPLVVIGVPAAVFAPRWPAFALTVCVFVVAPLTWGAGNRSEASSTDNGVWGDSRTLLRTTAEGVGFPLRILQRSGKLFPVLFMAGWFSLGSAAVSIAAPGWTELAQGLAYNPVSMFEHHPVRSPDAKAGPTAAPEAGPSAMPTAVVAPQLPPGCSPDALEGALVANGMGRSTAARVVVARAQFGYPIAGCEVGQIGRFERTTFVRYEGGTDATIVVDDGDEAHAVLSSDAVRLVQQELIRDDPQAARRISAYARAGAGRWTLLIGRDRSCRLLLKPDEGIKAYLFDARDTAAIARVAARLGAFPMVAGMSSPKRPVVRYLQKLDTRPGFVPVYDELRGHGPDSAAAKTVENRGCGTVRLVLQPLGTALEASAERTQ